MMKHTHTQYTVGCVCVCVCVYTHIYMGLKDIDFFDLPGQVDKNETFLVIHCHVNQNIPDFRNLYISWIPLVKRSKFYNVDIVYSFWIHSAWDIT